MSRKEELIEWYKDAFDYYGEALQETVSDYWQEKYGDDSWEEFHSLDGKLKVKFYYEGEE
jgi:hypothetical protein